MTGQREVVRDSLFLRIVVVLCLGVGLGFLLGAAWAALDSQIDGLDDLAWPALAAVFRMACLALAVAQLRAPRAELELAPEGLRDDASPKRLGWVPWSEITGVEL